MRDPEPPDDITWGWLLLGLAMLLAVAPVYAVTRGGSMRPHPQAPLTALFVACCVLWAAAAAIACYLLVRAPDWVGWMMLR